MGYLKCLLLVEDGGTTQVTLCAVGVAASHEHRGVQVDRALDWLTWSVAFLPRLVSIRQLCDCLVFAVLSLPEIWRFHLQDWEKARFFWKMDLLIIVYVVKGFLYGNFGVDGMLGCWCKLVVDDFHAHRNSVVQAVHRAGWGQQSVINEFLKQNIVKRISHLWLFLVLRSLHEISLRLLLYPFGVWLATRHKLQEPIIQADNRLLFLKLLLPRQVDKDRKPRKSLESREVKLRSLVVFIADQLKVWHIFHQTFLWRFWLWNHFDRRLLLMEICVNALCVMGVGRELGLCVLGLIIRFQNGLRFRLTGPWFRDVIRNALARRVFSLLVDGSFWPFSTVDRDCTRMQLGHKAVRGLVLATWLFLALNRALESGCRRLQFLAFELMQCLRGRDVYRIALNKPPQLDGLFHLGHRFVGVGLWVQHFDSIFGF